MFIEIDPTVGFTVALNLTRIDRIEVSDNMKTAIFMAGEAEPCHYTDEPYESLMQRIEKMRPGQMLGRWEEWA